MSDLVARVDRLCDLAEEALGPGGADRVAPLRDRLHGPLRVALAGKVKAGKSTLLNALVGERLAPTDAGECTRIVAEYHHGLTYDVAAVRRDGTRVPLPFQRDDALDIDLAGEPADGIAHLEVGWPSSALDAVTLVDTPGLSSLSDARIRTIDYLTPQDGGPAQVDAVLYLMRHLHERDASFLEAFTDSRLANASPVNAIAVLSRADEVGAGRPDAMDSAARIAARYRHDPRVRTLASTVVPVAGLLAETGATLRQDEYADLAVIAALPDGEREELLVSVERLTDPQRTSLAPERRRELVLRLGLFGVRHTVTSIREGRIGTAGELARELVAVSGLPELRRLLAGHFMARAVGLKARTALAGLRDLAVQEVGGDQPLLRAVEEVEAGSHELAELRLVHLVLAGATRFDEQERDEALRVTGSGGAVTRLGLDPDAPGDAQVAAALAGVERWRQRRSHPLVDPATAEACDAMARSYEGLHADVVG